MRRVFAGVVLLIVYGSLFPWRFASHPVSQMLKWPRHIGSDDILINLLLYVPVGLCAYYAFPLPARRRWLMPVAISFALSTCIEVLQAFVVVRSSEVTDIILNTLGGALGVALAVTLPSVPRVEWFLATCWAAHILSRDLAGSFVEGLGLFVAIGIVLTERMRRWRVPLALACYAGILLRGLAPFDFSRSPRNFSWVPFGGFLAYQSEASLSVLFAKLFWYGAAVWVVRRLGAPWWLGGAVAAMVLATIEIAQQYLPVHLPEITDPIMALLLAGAFAAISEERREAHAGC